VTNARFLTTQEDPYAKPFRTSQASYAQGGVKTADLIQRFAWKRPAGNGQYIIDPEVVFDECYQTMAERGANDHDATQVALSEARASVAKLSSSNMHKAAARQQPKLQALEAKIMAQHPVLPSAQHFPIGASQPGMQTTTKGGVQLGSPMSSPAARIPETRGHTPRANAEIETFSYHSADGVDYTWTKKIGGQIVPGYNGLLAILCGYELEMGGSVTTVLGAARLALIDNDNKTLFHPDAVAEEAQGESLAPGMVEVD